MKGFKKVNEWLAKSYGGIIIVFMICMTISLTLQIFYRYVLNIGLLWTEETSRFMCIWVAMLGASALVYERGHIRVSLIEDLVPKVRPPFLFIQNLMLLVFSVLMVWFAFDSLEMAARSVSPSMQVPMLLVYLIFPLATIGMLVHSVFRLLAQFWPGEEEEEKQV